MDGSADNTAGIEAGWLNLTTDLHTHSSLQHIAARRLRRRRRSDDVVAFCLIAPINPLVNASVNQLIRASD